MEKVIFNNDLIVDGQAFIVYCNAKDEIKKFHLINTFVSDEYFQALGAADKRYRTFRQDRVLRMFSSLEELNDFELETLDLEEFNLRLYHAQIVTPKERQLSICFTGFKAAIKKELETLATNNNLHVAKSVVQDLSFLCCGQNAGPKKIEKARVLGSIILTNEQFRHLVETGEIPESGEYDLAVS
ncbi:BRCT domain-containing protein [Pseudoalteromonas phenolica]|uniref:BRCT domain-containing protein n=1 Tax=Pseudoalteromonas phenolica TaxID=161398 RepID=UPI00384D5F00